MITDEEIINACQNNLTMAMAIKQLGMNHNTFRRRAKKLGCYNPNQSGKGIHKTYFSHTKESIERDFLSNKNPIKSSILKKYLFRFGIKEEKCEECGQKTIWNGKPLVLQLDHIDGNSQNNKLENIRIVCPNCHSQTSTFCSKNKTAP